MRGVARRSWHELDTENEDLKTQLGEAKQVAFDLRVKLDTLRPEKPSRDVETMQILLNQERAATQAERNKVNLLQETIVRALGRDRD